MLYLCFDSYFENFYFWWTLVLEQTGYREKLKKDGDDDDVLIFLKAIPY